jgi:hypothetical protein
MKINYMKPPKEFKISSTEWWVKPLDMMVHNWAFIENQASGKAVVYFFHDQGKTKGGGAIANPYKLYSQSSGYIAVIDSLEFENVPKAEKGLLRNGFTRLADTERPWTGGEPEGKFYDARIFESGLYSSDDYWKEGRKLKE